MAHVSDGTNAKREECRPLERDAVWLLKKQTLLVIADVPSSLIIFTLVMEAIRPPKRRFLQEAHSVTYQKTVFFRVTAVKLSNLT
jgi:hypothetical protein